MGWDSDTPERGENAADFLRRRLLPDCEVIDTHRLPGCIYAAVRRNGVTTALVAILEHGMVKILGEESQPYYYDCPQRILDLLSPLSSTGWMDYYILEAAEWRLQCARVLEQKAERKFASA